ncbi:MAG: PF20097 family protein [Eubacteriales bacterium]|nr:PF20097 family protein [Eubacteriales bacterium]
MKCPYCHKEMRAGYIQCRDGVTWNAKKQPVAALSILGKESVRLINGAAYHSKIVFAHKCSDCKVVIIPYD